MYKLAIFDLDGTLVDTLSSITKSVNTLRTALGAESVSESVVKPFIGKGTANMVRTLCDPSAEELDGFIETYNQIYEKNLLSELKIYEGIPQLLVSLKEHGLKVAVVTNKFHRQALDILESCFKTFPFDGVQGVTVDALKKPNPAMTTALVNQFNVQPSETIFIGDSEIDLLTAQSARVDFTFVSWGYRDAHQVKVNPNQIVNSSLELQNSILGNF